MAKERSKMKTRSLTKIAIAVVALVMSVGAYAVDNSIYIDQTGDNATINISQDGAGNRVRGIQGTGTGNTTPAVINGDGMAIDITQVGAGNVLNLGIQSTTAAAASPTSVNYSVSGGNNTGTINLNANGQGTNSSTTLDITQSGGNNVANINVLGSKNTLTAVQSGGSATLNSTVNASETTQTINTSGGTGNSVTTNLTGDKGTVVVDFVGASNTASITQAGGGTAGHNATLDVNGSSNSYTINQSGTIDTTVNIKTVGSGNTFGIVTKN
jgi:hypothetical protein